MVNKYICVIVSNILSTGSLNNTLHVAADKPYHRVGTLNCLWTHVEKSGNIMPKINRKMSPFASASGPMGPISMPNIYSTDY